MAGGYKRFIQGVSVRPMACLLLEVGQCRGQNAKCE